MPLPEKVVLDASALYALLSDRHTNHEVAVQTFEWLIDREVELWTTSYCLAEVSSFILEQAGVEAGSIFMEAILDAAHVYWVSNPAHEEAWQHVVRIHSPHFTLGCATTAVAARKLKAVVFAFEEHFLELSILILPSRRRVQKNRL